MKNAIRKLGSAFKLIRSKMYILVTEKQTVVNAKFKGNKFEALMILHAFKVAETNISEAISRFEKDITKEEKGGRHKTGRKNSSRNQQKKVL